ncbi:MAG: polyribonucleotide nucleotidyltransferase [Bacteroidetes bacterium]|nr:MAG: polyribonucleotide nucleotidyltransferase [Bacteroidota bacterium]
MNVITKSIDLPDGRTISIETGAIARQANGAVVLSCGDTMLLATAVAREEINLEMDFLPLSVDYIENFSSAGRFPGGFFKREGRLGEHEILTSRLIDRAIRPLFPDDYHGDTQLMIQLISADAQEQADALACVAASAALCVSDIPFPDPVSEVRVGRKNGEFIINPSRDDMEACDLDLIVAGTDDSINMVEGEMKEVSEEVMLEALKFAHEYIRMFNGLQRELRQAVGKSPREYDKLEFDEAMYQFIENSVGKEMAEIVHAATSKNERSEGFGKLKERVMEELKEHETFAEDEYLGVKASSYFKEIQKKIVRKMVLEESRRLDGRKLDEVRDIWGRVGYLKRAHGSALFTRGETQSLATVTLGTKLDEQTIDTATYRGTKRFLLHYNFPGFSTGEVKFNRGPGRREIGHGNLAERALKIVVPDDLPYTIRIVSNITESNGSSSMASVCSGTLALMDAGIQITKPVSGIAMGLISGEDGKFAVLSDILGDEDFLGDMDFKVTGTRDGLTACQMDIKIRGLSYEIIQQALEQSKAGRLHILDEMLKILPEPREDFSPYAPRFFEMAIPIEAFGSIIGPGGKVIQEIQRQTNTTIALEEIDAKNGTATIASEDAAGIEAAVKQIRALIQQPEVGEVYKAKVKSIMDYGAFVEFLPGKEGLLHISEISYDRLKSMDGVFNVGDEVEIKLIGIDQKSGKFRLSHKALLPKPEGYEERPNNRGGRGGDRNRDRDRRRR